MALEDAIQNLADALNRYTDTITPPVISGDVALKKSATSAKTTDTPASGTKAADTGVSDSKKASAQSAEAQSPSGSAQGATALASDATSTKSSAEPEFDLKDLQDKFAKLIEEDLDKAKEVLTELGFPKLKLVPANLHVKALALTEAALNG